MTQTERELREIVRGEVRFDDYTRTLYSTDASIYDITPIGVVIPRDEADVIAVVEYAYERGLPLLPRGGGSSLSGQAIGEAIILDFTKFMNTVLEVNEEEKWARVQPGVILDELNLALKASGLKFGPDPASSSRASMGGLIGNNSTGAHSILYGMTGDHILSLKVVLSNGEAAEVGPIEWDRKGSQALKKENGRIGHIEKGMEDLREEYDFQCENRYPKFRRNVAGYNLRDVKSNGQLDLCRLLCGSEGTLATVIEAKVRLVDLPKSTGMLLLCYRDLIEALRDVPAVLELNPSACEVVDEMLLELAKTSHEHGDTARALPEGTKAILLVEFYGNNRYEVLPRLEELKRLGLEEWGRAFVAREATSGPEQAALWNLRKAGLPILLSRPGDAKPTAFVEDTAVPPNHLADYISEFLDIVERFGTTTAVYAHAGAGCLHIRPVINLKDAGDVEKMHALAEATMELAIRCGGTTSSEHGDGLARTQWLKRLYGPELVEAFGRVKELFDPKGIMNPGKIVNAKADLRENLRYRQRVETPDVRPSMNFESQIDLVRSIEMCNGCGGCRNRSSGVMCPSFRGTGDEITSTRGRANLMRQALTGKLPHSELTSQRFKKQVLELCLGCKACKRECPSGVDLAKLKTEIKYQFIQEHGASLRDRLFGHMDRFSQVGSGLAPVANILNASAVGKFFLEKFLGIDSRRALPQFHWMTFERWFQARKPLAHASIRGRVAFFYDCAINHNRPEIGQAAVNSLEALGYEVVLADRQCCGRPMLSQGLVDDAREKAIYNVRHLADQIRAGYEIVGCEPSCMVTIQDEYRDLLDSEDLPLVEQHTFELMEFLHREHLRQKLALAGARLAKPLLVHGHCHQKAMGRAHYTAEVLKLLPGAKVEMLDSGCCGMAGAFGFEKEHYDLSMDIADLLFAKIREKPGVVVASGVSCRMQIEHGMDREAAHPAEILWNCLKNGLAS